MKAKIDVDMGDGVHITVSAGGETQKEALELAYSRVSSILGWMRAVEDEAKSNSIVLEQEQVVVMGKPVRPWEGGGGRG